MASAILRSAGEVAKSIPWKTVGKTMKKVGGIVGTVGTLIVVIATK